MVIQLDTLIFEEDKRVSEYAQSHALVDFLHLYRQRKKVYTCLQLLVKDMELFVNGEEIHMNEFVRKVIRDVMMALLANLRDVDLSEVKRLDVS